jgi:DNA-binding NarL/FixJ family response regulator
VAKARARVALRDDGRSEAYVETLPQPPEKAFIEASLPPEPRPLALLETAGHDEASCQDSLPLDALTGSSAETSASVAGLSLTRRELEILSKLAQGQRPKIIARELGISNHTVTNHVLRVMDKVLSLDCIQVAIYAARQGWPTPQSQKHPEAIPYE